MIDTEQLQIDVNFMLEALREARDAFEEEEVPIGCVIVAPDEKGIERVIARGHNMTQRLKDPTAHAEMLAITSATSAIEAKYLIDCTLYVTVEPCPMCASALCWGQIKRVVYGCEDPKKGAHLFRKEGEKTNCSLYHPKTEVVGGILAEQCAQLMQEFFKGKR